MRLILALLLLGSLLPAAPAADYPVQPVSFTAVRLTDGFWKRRQDINRTVTVPFAMRQCEESGRLRNFDLAAEVMRRRATGEPHYEVTPPTLYPFDDTDAYKALEAASYVLNVQRDPALSRLVDSWIGRIAAAQEPDGYLYTFRTMHPDSPGHKWVGRQRWENDPALSHELYDCGHLYEAGYAHFAATGQRTLLDVCIKNADLLWRDFGDGTRRIAPGHEIVEMGLVKLYRATGDGRYLKLAKIFLDARGPGGPEYNQRQALVVDQRTAVGHAVRANYLYGGMADVAALTGDGRYETAIKRIWENVVETKLYLTGGVGALRKGEAYGADYELPNDAYNETCAAVALMMWNHRMFLLTGESQYMDVFERTAFNGFLSGVSLSGDRFFYPNPLEYDGHSAVNNGFAGRAPWFGCACCPPNLMRTLASITGYFYAVKGDSVYVNFYAPSEAGFNVAETAINLTQESGYPWDGAVRLRVALQRPAEFTMRLRIPGWAQGRPVPSDLYTYGEPALPWSLRVNGAPVAARLEKGYAVIARRWQRGDVVELDLPIVTHSVRGNEKIAATRGRVAFERGPIVYCVEGAEQNGAAALANWVAPGGPASQLEVKFRPDLLEGVRTLTLGPTLTAIPYFAWDNCGLAPMAVWLSQPNRD